MLNVDINIYAVLKAQSSQNVIATTKYKYTVKISF